MQGRDVFKTPKLAELKKRRQRAFFKKAALLGFAMVAFLALFAYLSRRPGINIEEIAVAGNSIVETDAIASTVKKEIEGNYFWLFPKTNLLIYPKAKIKTALENQFKRLDEISLAIEDNRRLIVSVSEREPWATWCGAEPRAQKEDNAAACYFLDQDGYIFDEAPYFSGDVYFKLFGNDGIKAPDPAGSRFAEKDFAELRNFKQNLEAIGLEPVAAYLKTDGDAEFYLKSQKAPEPKILVRLAAGAENLAQNLEAALDTEPLKTRMKKEYAKLEYLDLRFDNKVYSKFRTI